MKNSLLVISSESDSFAARFAAFATGQGTDVTCCDLASSSRLLSIELVSGQSRVWPQYPILFRVGTPPNVTTFEQEFEQWEQLAAVWSAASLTSAPVVNRPDVYGLHGRMTASPRINESRCQLATRGEVYTSSLDDLSMEAATLWAYDCHSKEAAGVDDMKVRGRGPYRVRPGFASPGYEEVTVVGAKAWRSSSLDIPGLDLEHRSTEAAKKLRLSFASFLWYVDPALQEAEIAQINAFPQPRPEDDSHVCAALLEELMQ